MPSANRIPPESGFDLVTPGERGDLGSAITDGLKSPRHRRSLTRSYVPLPKSVTPARIKSNMDVYDFELDAADMEALDGLDEGAKGACSWNPVDSP